VTATGSREALQARVDELEFEVAELRAALAPPGWMPPRAWKLTERERALFALFLAREVVTSALVQVTLWPDAAGPLARNAQHVYLHRLRRKLAPFGVQLQFLGRGLGYSLPPAQRAALRAGAVHVTPEEGGP
jgi:DNA-binding response OmpR family regulator